MYCEGCGTHLSASTKYCGKCGLDTTSASTPHAAEVSSSPSITELAGVASRDTLNTLRALAADPLGSIGPAYARLDSHRAIGVGIGFGVLYDVCLMLAIGRLASAPGFAFALGIARSVGYDIPWLNLFALGFVPFLSLIAALAVTRKLMRGAGSVHGDTLIAGLSIAPIGFVLAVGSLLGYPNVEVSVALAVFGLSYTILILYTGLVYVAKIRDSLATLAVPLILLLGAWIVKTTYSSILTSGWPR